jgi:hypothetical protein
MSLRVKHDSSKVGGGYAILSSSDQALPISVAIEDRSNGLFLCKGGDWAKTRVYHSVDPIDEKTVRLGPDIVDHIPSDTPIAIFAGDASRIGVLVWKQIQPSAGLSTGNVIRTSRENSVLLRPTFVPEEVVVPGGVSASPATDIVVTIETIS